MQSTVPDDSYFREDESKYEECVVVTWNEHSQKCFHSMTFYNK